MQARKHALFKYEVLIAKEMAIELLELDASTVNGKPRPLSEKIDDEKHGSWRSKGKLCPLQ